MAYAFQILIGAALGAGFQSTLGQALSGVARVGDALKEATARAEELDRETAKLDGARRAGEAWRDAGRRALDASRNYEAAKARVGELARETPKAGDAAKKHAADLDAARREVQKAAAEYDKQRTALKASGEAARAAGLDTRNYAAEQRRVAEALKTVETRAKSTAQEIESLRRKQDRGAALGAAWGNASNGGIGTAIAGIGLGGAIAGALDFESVLLDIGITADMSDARLRALRGTLIGLGRDTGQSKEQLAGAFRTLVSAGLDAERAEAALAAVGKTATASGADIEDIAKTAFQLMDTLGVRPEGLAAELDRLALAGKAGSFELRDMARALPALAPMASALKLQGAEAVSTLGAAFQIAKLGAADSATAANNLLNFMTKAASPETIKNFEEFGVNIPRVIDKALREGRNPFDAIMEQTDKLLSRARTDGQKAEMLGKLFGDMQVQAFVRPMLANMAKYREMRAEFDRASGGTVDGDFQRRMESTGGAVTQARIALGELSTALGSAFLPPLGAAARLLAPVFEGIAEISNALPTMTAVTLAGAVAWRVLGTALVANPIGATIAGIALGAALLIDNWSTVRDFFTTLWESPTEAFRTFEGYIGAAWSRIAAPFEAVRSWFGGGKQAAAPRDPGLEAEGRLAEAQRREMTARVDVNFANAPRGTRVAASGATPPGLDLGVATGYALGGP